MKKAGFILIILMAGCFMQGRSQSIPTWPIPSYGISVTGFGNFLPQQVKSPVDNLDKKREVHIHLRSASAEQPECSATVWVYRVDYSIILGPYAMLCGETLDVEIDEEDWGVLVQTTYSVVVDVWYD